MNNFLNKEGLVHRHRISNVYLCQSLYCYEMASYFNQKLFSFKTSILYFCHMSWTQPRYKYFHITLLLCFAITLALTKQLSIRPESNIVPFRVYKVTLFNTMVIVWIGKTLSNALLDVQLSTLQSSLMHLYHRWARGGGGGCTHAWRAKIARHPAWKKQGGHFFHFFWQNHPPVY